MIHGWSAFGGPTNGGHDVLIMNQNTSDTPLFDEKPEGLDPVTSDGWGDYPLDAVFVRTETRSVSEVVKRIEN
jgi:hypothetical protein